MRIIEFKTVAVAGKKRPWIPLSIQHADKIVQPARSESRRNTGFFRLSALPDDDLTFLGFWDGFSSNSFVYHFKSKFRDFLENLLGRALGQIERTLQIDRTRI